MKKIIHWFSTAHPLELTLRGLFASIAILLFSFAAWQTFLSILTTKTHTKQTATVTSCHVVGSPNAKFSTYACEVKYQTLMGRRSATIDKLLIKHNPGDTVEIYIGTGTQYSVQPGGFLGLWAIPTLLSVFGLIFLTSALWPSKKNGSS